MTTTSDNSEPGQPLGLALTEGLGPLPEAAMVETNPYGEAGTLEWYDADQMRAYAAHEVASERKRCAALCRRVADETRNSEDARTAGRMLANWISTGNPNDPGPN